VTQHWFTARQIFCEAATYRDSYAELTQCRPTEVVIGRFKGEVVLLDSARDKGARDEYAGAALAPPPQAVPAARDLDDDI
jgi:hypothetical protein